MEINSVNLLALDQKLKLNKMRNEKPEGPVSEPVDSNPESTMKALQMQANNNVAFQAGLNNKLAGNMDKFGKTALLVLAAMFATNSLTSCEPGAMHQEQTMNVVVNLSSEQLAAIAQSLTSIEQLLETNNKLGEENNKLTEGQTQLLQYVASTLTEMKEQDKNLFDLMAQEIVNNEIYKQGVLDALVAQGKSLSEANAFWERLLGHFENGEYEKFANEVISLLTSLNINVEKILNVVTEYAVKSLANQELLIALREEDIEMLKNLYMQGEVNQYILKRLLENSDKANEYLEQDVELTNNLIKIFEDPEKYQQFLNDLKGILADNTSEAYANLEALFKKYGIDNLNLLIETKGEKIIEILRAYIEKDVQIQLDNQTILKETLANVNFIAMYLKGIDPKMIDAALAEILNAIKENTTVSKEANQKLDEIIKKFDKLADEFATLAANTDDFKAYFAEGLGILKNIDLNTAVSANKMDQLINGNNLTNSYLYIMMNDIKGLKDAIGEIPGASGMTVDEFKAALAERDSVRDAEIADKFDDYVAFLDSKFNGLGAKLDNMGDVMVSIDGKLDNLKVLVDGQKQIIDMIGSIDWAQVNPEDVAKIRELLENWEHVCNHVINVECDCQGNDETVVNPDDILGDLMDELNKQPQK